MTSAGPDFSFHYVTRFFNNFKTAGTILDFKKVKGKRKRVMAEEKKEEKVTSINFFSTQTPTA